MGRDLFQYTKRSHLSFRPGLVGSYKQAFKDAYNFHNMNFQFFQVNAVNKAIRNSSKLHYTYLVFF